MIFLELTLVPEGVPILVNLEQIQHINTCIDSNEPGKTWIALIDRSFTVEETFDEIRELLVKEAMARVIYYK